MVSLLSLDQKLRPAEKMSGAAVAVLVVPLALGLLVWWLDFQTHRSRPFVATADNVYPVALWVHAVFLCFGCMSLTFLVCGLDESRNQGARELMMAIGSIGLVVAISASVWYAKSAVRITDEELVLEAPFSSKAVRFDKIKEVHVAGGMIILDEGKIPRFTIPIIYRKSGLLLANIEARRFNLQKRPQV